MSPHHGCDSALLRRSQAKNSRNDCARLVLAEEKQGVGPHTNSLLTINGTKYPTLLRKLRIIKSRGLIE
ncbi:hypothetical protein TNCV_59921 [Trichonephila clavipes]|nr:hypothetical protein TNCV_59921 [Trichonephila clavipes]